jgi:hypothetical protein
MMWRKKRGEVIKKRNDGRKRICKKEDGSGIEIYIVGTINTERSLSL